MKKKQLMKNIANIAVATAVAASFSSVASAMMEDQEKEKCYGVTKAAKNDCGNARHSCAGHSAKDGEGDEWIYIAKGNCERLVNGSLTPVVMPEVIEETPEVNVGEMEVQEDDMQVNDEEVHVEENNMDDQH